MSLYGLNYDAVLITKNRVLFIDPTWDGVFSIQVDDNIYLIAAVLYENIYQ